MRVAALPLLLALALLCWLRLPSNQVQILNVDEADFAVEAGALLDGGRPYVDFVEKKPPLVYLLYAGALSLVGRWNLPGMRLLLLGWVLASAALLAAIARRLWGDRAAWIAAPLHALAVSAGPPMDLHAANAETLFLLPLLAGTWLCLPPAAGDERPGTRRSWTARRFWAGVCIGLAALIKQQAGMQLPILGAFLLLGCPPLLPAGPWRERLQPAAALASGFAAAWLLALAGLWAVGSLGEFYYWTIDVNRYYIAHGNGLRDGLLLFAGALGTLAAFVPALWLLALGEAVREAARARTRQPLVLLWLAGSLLPIALGGRFFLHYFLQWLPPVVLLASAAAAGLWEALAARPRARAAAAAAACLVTLAPLWQRMAPFRDPEVLAIPHAMPQARALADRVRETTAPGDRLLVWGYGSAIHYLSQRQPATRFPYVTYLVGAVEGTPAWWSPFHPSRPLEIARAWDLLFEDLGRHPPELVIDTSRPGYFAFYKFPPAKYPRLMDYLAHGYEKTELEGFPVWRRVRPDARATLAAPR